MGMYKTCYTAEESLCVDTKWLKEHGYFCGYKSGGITWTWGWGSESSISFSVDTSDDLPIIRFRYTTSSWGEGKKDINYIVPMVKVPCNFGGFRWAFKCELSSNGYYCGRVIYNLYKANSDYFGCRKCMRIVYDSQRKSGGRFECFGKALDASQKASELYGQIHKWTYRGKLTKKAEKYRRLVQQMPSLNQMAKMQSDLLLDKKGR